ncbi:MAG: peptidylprolyl isomerase [Saprospiraceae bacterium]
MTNLEETRVLKYVEIPVKPSASDMSTLFEEVNQLKNDFAASENDSLFTLTHDGVYTNIYYKKDELPQQLKDDSISLTLGTIVGPYSDGEKFTVAKVIGIKVIPDSVKARHILRSVQPGDTEGLKAAKNTIDSLKNVLESGQGTFTELAKQYSQDQGSAVKGGDLGTFPQGRMGSPEFNEACFMGSEGNYYVVTTQFGVHLYRCSGSDFYQ